PHPHHPPPSFFTRLRQHPPSPLFPYTTLFRSTGPAGFCEQQHAIEGIADAAGKRADKVGLAETVLGEELIGSEAIEVGPAEINISEEHTSELQSLDHVVCRLLPERKDGAAGRH